MASGPGTVLNTQKNSMGYIQTDKNQLSVMYAFEYLIEISINRVRENNVE